MDEEDDKKCPVCGGRIFYPRTALCDECAEYKRNIEAQRRNQARRRHFGSIWCDEP